MGHLLTWQLLSLDVAKELALGERSPSHERADADWEARGGDAVNAEADADWRASSIDEVRQEFARVAGELRGFLTVVPETRWVKNADQQRFFYEETTEHYEDHLADLAAILAAAGRGVTDEPVSDLSLADILAAAAEELDGIATSRRWRLDHLGRRRRVFATLPADRAEFRLDPLVAAAALRTPGHHPVVARPGVDRVRAGPSSTMRRSTGPRPGSSAPTGSRAAPRH